MNGRILLVFKDTRDQLCWTKQERFESAMILFSKTLSVKYWILTKMSLVLPLPMQPWATHVSPVSICTFLSKAAVIAAVLPAIMFCDDNKKKKDCGEKGILKTLNVIHPCFRLLFVNNDQPKSAGQLCFEAIIVSVSLHSDVLGLLLVERPSLLSHRL